MLENCCYLEYNEFYRSNSVLDFRPTEYKFVPLTCEIVMGARVALFKLGTF